MVSTSLKRIVPSFVEKEIHAGKTAAAKRTIHRFGGFRRGRLLFFGNARRAMNP